LEANHKALDAVIRGVKICLSCLSRFNLINFGFARSND
jgi:hypothetical protein